MRTDQRTWQQNSMCKLTTASSPAYTLVVLGGTTLDVPLATDFVAISKKFIADGLNPTCLSGTDLQNVTYMNGPLIFDRDDLRQRSQVYNSIEAQNPFYHLAGQEGLKHRVLTWIGNVSSCLRSGDRLIIVFVGHGQRNSGDIILNSRRGEEYLTKTEITASLSRLPPNVRVLLANEACHSGTWTTIACDAGANRDILVETAATIGERAYNYVSGSGRTRCSLFGAAFIQELATYPDGQIVRHHTHIKEEMQHVAPDQPTGTPMALITSSRSLRSYNISHFVLSPNIARAIMHAASEQSRHESTLLSRANARSFWARLRRTTTEGPGIANGAPEGSDLKLAAIKMYLEDLGSRIAESSRGAMVTACHLVLEGRGGQELIDRVVRTIAWENTQMLRVQELLDHLVDKNLIFYLFSAEEAKEALASGGNIADPVVERILNIPVVRGMTHPSWYDGYVDFVFEDARDWVCDVLLCNCILCPSRFDLDKIVASISEFPGSSPIAIF